MKRLVRSAALFAIIAVTCRTPGQARPESTVSPAVHLSEKASDADSYVTNLQFSDLARSVAGMKSSPERDYFAGVLANREGRIVESINLLEKVIPQVRSAHPGRAAVALHTLADDYVKSYAYGKAIAVYEELLHNFASQLDTAERQSTRDDYAVVRLLKNVPPQTISLEGAVDLPIHRNPVLGTIDAELTVSGITAAWILDTGANFTTVSASFARRLGVPISKGEAQTQGITGAENRLRVAVLPELKLGSASVRNVVLLVLDDANLNVPAGKRTRFQIHAVLGYPVLHALQRITFTRDGHFLAGPSSADSAGARLFMNQLTPLLECEVEGSRILFSFDTGANTTVFSVRYQRAFPAQFLGLKKRPHALGGAGGVRHLEAYYLPQVELGIGTAVAKLRNVPVLPPLGTDGDKLFGNLGRDLTNAYRSFTMDFGTMRFELGPPAA